MITSDFHVHSSFSTDCSSSMESMIEKAISLGFERICITDHLDYDYPSLSGTDFLLDVKSYLLKLDELSNIYREKIKILKGIELGLIPYLSHRYTTLINEYSFDFVIGSTHLINKEDPYYPEFWGKTSINQGLLDYFNGIYKNITAFKDFDTCAHLDYILRYLPQRNNTFSYEKYQDIIDSILSELIKMDKCLEVNTAGYKYSLGEPNPSKEILKRYYDLGGRFITIGSDCHLPEHMAYNFNSTKTLLTSIGYKEYCVFEKRNRIICKL